VLRRRARGVLRVDGDDRKRLACGEQHPGPQLTDVVAALLRDALGLELVDPVAGDRRRAPVEDAARVDDGAGPPVEPLAVEHAAIGGQLRQAARHRRVEVARDREHLAVGRDLLVLPRDVDLERAERLGRLGRRDVVDREVLAAGHVEAVADDLRSGRQADVLLDRAEVLDVVGRDPVGAAVIGAWCSQRTDSRNLVVFGAGLEQMFCYPDALDGQVGFAMHAVSQGRSGRNICPS
jgi:hypothetical protein